MAEFKLGTLSSDPIAALNFVGETDTSDVFSFSLDSTSNLNISLVGMSEDADIRLYRDKNNNGVIDSGERITSSILVGAADDSINRRTNAGNYLVEVSQGTEDNNTKYALGLSTSNPTSSNPNERASNLLPTEVEVGILDDEGSFSVSNRVSTTDTSDVYHFSLSEASDIELSLTGLSADADVRLIQDFNSNLVVDSDDFVRLSSNGSSNSESISTSLESGDNYFVQVFQFTGNTNYTLDLGIA